MLFYRLNIYNQTQTGREYKKRMDSLLTKAWLIGGISTLDSNCKYVKCRFSTTIVPY